jgi:antitoxin (DNA-binding transcriptional repressor) of toxin-antitoxin stability system
MYTMKRYTVALVRERLAEALDEAERGEPVFIERKGVRYRLSLDTTKPRRTRRTSRIQTVDPAVAEGRWTWDWTATGARFRAPRKT